MHIIHLETLIKAPIEACFDATRNIDLHQLSTTQTQEKAVAGKMNGLIEEGESVTWEAVHFGIRQRLTVKITAMQRPTYFSDEMLKGAFKKMKHQHFFEQKGKNTLMIDHFRYETPFGIFGYIFDQLILKKYMTRFLIKRNNTLKQILEKNP
jgi:ligand-binding SRPBCC domain-containing protein